MSNNLENVEGEITEIADIADVMGVDPDELGDPGTLYRFQEIIEFFAGKADKRFVINSLIVKMGGKVNVIDHVWNYVQLRKEHITISERMEELKKELKYYE